jgi:hypothetical protein
MAQLKDTGMMALQHRHCGACPAKPNKAHKQKNLHSTHLYCLFLKMTNNNNTQGGEDPEGDEEVWVATIKQRVGKQLFGNIQFITCEEDEKYGSVWQKLLCRKLPGCPIEKQELFWKTKGMTEARKALNRKRQNTNNAMKREFIGKLNNNGDCVVCGVVKLVLKHSQFALPPCHSILSIAPLAYYYLFSVVFLCQSSTGKESSCRTLRKC